MTARRQPPGRPAWAHALREGWAGLGCALALLLGPLGAWAQEAQAPTTPAMNAANVVSAGVGSLPSAIPVKRDALGEDAGVADARWWLAALFIAGLGACGIVAVRRGTTDPTAPGTWRTGWRKFAESGAAQRELRRIASIRLTPRHSLHVVEWNGRQLLLGCSEKSMHLLAESMVKEGSAAAPGTSHGTAPPREARST